MSRSDSLTVSEDVYRRLRAAIVKGVYRPNQRLVEAELAETLDASRTPVRESLQKLYAEGLVGMHRRGWIVREHTAAEIHQIYDVRIPLEGYAAGLAAERADAEKVDRIVAVASDLTPELAEADRSRFVELHDDFHDTIYAAAENPVLTEMIRIHRHHHFNRRVTRLYTPAQLAVTIREHNEMVEALQQRDSHRLEQVTRQHLRHAKEITIALAENE